MLPLDPFILIGGGASFIHLLTGPHDGGGGQGGVGPLSPGQGGVSVPPFVFNGPTVGGGGGKTHVLPLDPFILMGGGDSFTSSPDPMMGGGLGGRTPQSRAGGGGSVPPFFFNRPPVGRGGGAPMCSHWTPSSWWWGGGLHSPPHQIP